MTEDEMTPEQASDWIKAECKRAIEKALLEAPDRPLTEDEMMPPQWWVDTVRRSYERALMASGQLRHDDAGLAAITSAMQKQEPAVDIQVTNVVYDHATRHVSFDVAVTPKEIELTFNITPPSEP